MFRNMMSIAVTVVILSGIAYAFVRGFIQFLRSVDPKPEGPGYPRCPMCSFDVRGLQHFECPECGTDLMEVGIIGARPPLDTKQILDRGIAGAILLTIGVLIASSIVFIAVFDAPGWHILIPPVLAAAVMAFFIWRGHSRRMTEARQRLDIAMKTREQRRAARAHQDGAQALTHHPPH